MSDSISPNDYENTPLDIKYLSPNDLHETSENMYNSIYDSKLGIRTSTLREYSKKKKKFPVNYSRSLFNLFIDECRKNLPPGNDNLFYDETIKKLLVVNTTNNYKKIATDNDLMMFFNDRIFRLPIKIEGYRTGSWTCIKVQYEKVNLGLTKMIKKELIRHFTNDNDLTFTKQGVIDDFYECLDNTKIEGIKENEIREKPISVRALKIILNQKGQTFYQTLETCNYVRLETRKPENRSKIIGYVHFDFHRKYLKMKEEERYLHMIKEDDIIDSSGNNYQLKNT